MAHNISGKVSHLFSSEVPFSVRKQLTGIVSHRGRHADPCNYRPRAHAFYIIIITGVKVRDQCHTQCAKNAKEKH